jgi:hypothetical protein
LSTNVILLESNFEKVAYKFGDTIKEYIEKNVKPAKGSYFYLINAMGADAKSRRLPE